MNTKHKQTVIFLVTIFLYIAFFLRAQDAINGAKQAIILCADTVIPTLLPSLIFSGIITANGFPARLKKLLRLPLKIGFSLPVSCAEICLLGTCGGYPLAFVTAVSAYNADKTDKQTAANAANVCFSPGLAFTLITVGQGLFSSIKTGLLLYLSVLISDIFTAHLIKHRTKESAPADNLASSILLSADLLCESVNKALQSVLNIGVWIILFGALQGIVNTLPLPPVLQKAVYLSEVTSAVKYCAQAGNLPLCAFCLGFGGICVFLQLLPLMHTLSVSVRRYLFFRLVSGMVSYFTAKLLCRIFPEALTVANVGLQSVAVTRYSPVSCLLLLFFAIVFMADMKMVLQKK